MSIAIAAEPSVLHVDESGTIRIGSTRVSLESLIAAFRRGATAEQISQDFDSLTLAEVYCAIGYYLGHQEQLDEYVARQDQQAEEFRTRNPDLYAHGVRERLLARKKLDRAS